MPLGGVRTAYTISLLLRESKRGRSYKEAAERAFLDFLNMKGYSVRDLRDLRRLKGVPKLYEEFIRYVAMTRTATTTRRIASFLHASLDRLGIEVPVVKVEPEHILTKEYVFNRLRSASPVYRTVVGLIVLSGLTPSEIVELTVRDYWEWKRVYVAGHVFGVWDSVFIAPMVLEAIDSFASKRSDRLFLTSTGQPFTPKRVSYAIKRVFPIPVTAKKLREWYLGQGIRSLEDYALWYLGQA